MCFGSCRVTCDNCKPKFVYCPECGRKNMLDFKACKQCGPLLTGEMKEHAIEEWEAGARARAERKERL